MEGRMPPSIFETRREVFYEKPLPNSHDAERAVLGAILVDNNTIVEALPLAPEDFYSPLHNNVFSAMISLFDQSKRIDPITILEEMKKKGPTESFGGIATISSLTFGVPPVGISDHVKVIRDTADARALARACQEITADILAEERPVDEVVEEAETKIYAIRSGQKESSAVLAGEEVAKSLEGARSRKASGSVIVGIPSGFGEMDKWLQGFREGDQVVLAARPSVGKTALGVKIAYNVAVLEGVPTVVFELEMTKERLADRIICAEAGINSYLLRSGHLTGEQWEQAEEVEASMRGAPLYLNDSPRVSTRTIRTELRRINTTLRKHNTKVGLVVVDHIGLMKNEVEKRGRNREGEVAEISRTLKEIAKEFRCTVLTLSQLNRQSETRADHRPLMSDLRESGSIEQDADIVAFLFREDMYQRDASMHNNIAELIIGKNRDGPTGTIKLHFDGKYARFSDLSQVAEDTRQLGPEQGDIVL